MTTLCEQQNRTIELSSKDLDNIKLKSKEEGIIIGREHASMSSEASTHIINIEARMEKMENKVDALKDDLNDLRTEVKTGFAQLPLEMKLSLEESVRNMFAEADKRYASKLSERMVYATASVMLLGVLGALTALVIR